MSSSKVAGSSSGKQQRRSTNDNNDNDSLSSSEFSDDDFLTMNKDGGKDGVDREAMIRKKLMESFYGKSAVGGSDSPSKDASGLAGGDPSKSTTSRRTSSTPFDDDDDMDSDDDDYDDYGRRRSYLSGGVASGGGGGGGGGGVATTEDLDSPNFDAPGHTSKHVFGGSVHELLELEESLACQVRTLDSTMQTLVYENYSRFIDATDAIRSIGNHVQANTKPLEQLQKSIKLVADSSYQVEQTVGNWRDQVVEKLRVQRLLQRLDTLLKLPVTLRENISTGRYRSATKSYLSANSILKKQSSGFESLQRIETECFAIMQDLIHQVQFKLQHWSGQGLLFIGGDDDSDRYTEDDGDDDEENKEVEYKKNTNATMAAAMHDEEPPDPPETIADIFECAGTPPLIWGQQRDQPATTDAADGDNVEAGADVSATPDGSNDNDDPDSSPSPSSSLKPTLSLEQCQEMSLSASLRLLERILDAHSIELQEAMLLNSTATAKGGSNTHLTPTASRDEFDDTPMAGPGGTIISPLIPTHVLDNILQVSALYSMTFVQQDDDDADGGGPTDGDRDMQRQQTQHQHDERLSHFVFTAFHTFLTHVRSALLEHTMLAQPAIPTQLEKRKKRKQGRGKSIDTSSDVDSMDELSGGVGGSEGGAGGITKEQQVHEEIAAATTILVQAVRQLASGLALPEVAVNAELAFSLVDQTIGLTEGMVRRRVDQKFYSLRIKVIDNCLAPFCEKAVLKMNNANDDEMGLMEMVQLASVALSDSLQLVDDAIRSILAKEQLLLDEADGSSSAVPGGTTSISGPSSPADDVLMLKEAVEQSAKRFAVWLASAMEILAGCESSDPKTTMEIRRGPAFDTGDSALADADHNLGSGAPRKADPFSSGDGDDNMSEISQDNKNESTQFVEFALWELVDMISTASTPETSRKRLNMALAIAEMCRVAERSVTDNIHQSIAIHGGGGKKQRKAKKTGRLFGDDDDDDGEVDGVDDANVDAIGDRGGIGVGGMGSAIGVGKKSLRKKLLSNPTGLRFRLAALRVLNLYAMDRGHEAASLLCSKLHMLSDRPEGYDEDDLMQPRPVTWQVLEIVKSTCLDCADLFGGKRRAGPIPENLEDEYTGLSSVLPASHRQNRTAGLAFDIERMFAEKVVIYRHFSTFTTGTTTTTSTSNNTTGNNNNNDMNEFNKAANADDDFDETERFFSRNEVVALIFKIVFKAVIETSRQMKFSINGYRQLVMDMECFKFYLPHYVKDSEQSVSSFAGGGGSTGGATTTQITSSSASSGSSSHHIASIEQLISDVTVTARNRCWEDTDESSATGMNLTDDEINPARSAIRIFLSTNSELISKFTIDED